MSLVEVNQAIISLVVLIYLFKSIMVFFAEHVGRVLSLWYILGDKANNI